MINNFFVRAFSDENELKITLDGYFMKSELDLALQLAKLETKKLMPGFSVLLNVENLNTADEELKLDFERFERIIKLMGGGSLRIAGLDAALFGLKTKSVGFYPYENEWFL